MKNAKYHGIYEASIQNARLFLTVLFWF